MEKRETIKEARENKKASKKMIAGMSEAGRKLKKESERKETEPQAIDKLAEGYVPPEAQEEYTKGRAEKEEVERAKEEEVRKNQERAEKIQETIEKGGRVLNKDLEFYIKYQQEQLNEKEEQIRAQNEQIERLTADKISREVKEQLGGPKLPEAKNLAEVLGEKSNEEEKQKEWSRMYKIFSKSEKVCSYTKNGKTRYLKLKEGVLKEDEVPDKNSELIFNVYDENGRKLQYKNGNDVEIIKTVGSLKYREWGKTAEAPKNGSSYLTEKGEVVALKVEEKEGRYILKNAENDEVIGEKSLNQLRQYGGVYRDNIPSRLEVKTNFEKQQEKLKKQTKDSPGKGFSLEISKKRWWQRLFGK